MQFLLIFLALFLVNNYVISENEIVIDYFVYKDVESVVGITCYNISENMSLIKDLNKKNIAAIISELNVKSNIQFLIKATYWKVGILVDSRCHSMSDIASFFNEATDYRLFDELRSWFILSNDLKQVLNAVNDNAFGISTDFVIAASTNLGTYELHDVYNIFKARGALLNVTYYGDWQYERGLTVNLSCLKFRRRANLHGLVVKAMFYKSHFKPSGMPLEEYYEDYEHATGDCQSKFSFHILSHLSYIYNFSLHTSESSEWRKGDRVGPIERALVNREIDISGTPVTTNTRRLKTMKYIHHGWPFRSCFFFHNPERTYIEMTEILRPLAYQVWYFMGFFVSTSVVVLLMVLRQDCNESYIILCSNSFLVVLGALCQQSTEVKMLRYSTRIAFIFVMIFSLLIFNYYAASVVSVRLDDYDLKINDSLIQLGKLNLKMATEDMVYFEFFIKKADWETTVFYENYWKKIPESEQYLEPDTGMRLMQKGGFAYHTHTEIGYLFIDKFFNRREICQVTEVNLGGPFITYFSMDFNSTFVDIGRVGMMRISETGLRLRQLHKWQYRKPICHRDVLNADSITIYEFAPHLILLSIGMMLAVIVLILEIFVSNRGHFQIRSKFFSVIYRRMSCGQVQKEDYFRNVF